MKVLFSFLNVVILFADRFSSSYLLLLVRQCRHLPKSPRQTRYETMLLSTKVALVALVVTGLINPNNGLHLSSTSTFCGQSLQMGNYAAVSNDDRRGVASLTMRKQKASDRRTRRMQRGGDDIAQDMINESLQRTITTVPMTQWNYKSRGNARQPLIKEKTGGRGRSRKRSTLYHSLSSYHSKYFNLLTAEYKAEVRRRRI